jgi:tetratricopeptide (TPR) repeat protein
MRRLASDFANRGRANDFGWAGCAVPNGKLRPDIVKRAQTLLSQAIELARQANDEPWLVRCLTNLAWILLDLGDLNEGERVLIEALPLVQRSGIDLELDRSTILLGDLARLRGEDATARDRYRELLAAGRADFAHWAQRYLSHLALRAGQPSEARSWLRQVLAHCVREQNRSGLVECIVATGAQALATNDPASAAQFAGAVEAGLAEIGGVLYFGDRFEYEKVLVALRTMLSPDQLATELAVGRSWTLDRAIARVEEWLGVT